MRGRWAATLLVASAAGATGVSGTPGDGIKLDCWTLIPYVDEAMTYDSNIHQTHDDAEDDTYWDSEAGLRFSRVTGPAAPVFDGGLFFTQRLGAEAGDFTAFGDALRFRRDAGAGWRYEATHSFRRVEDVDQHASDLQSGGVAADIGGASADLVQDIHTLSERRDIHQFGYATDHDLTDKSELGLAYRYSAIRYEDGYYQDLDGHILQLEGAFRLTERTATFLSLREGVQNQEDMSSPTDYSVLRAGFKSRGTSKMEYKAAAGVLRHHRPDSDMTDGSSTTTEFNYDVSADWLATEKVTLRAGANNGIQMSSLYSGNALDYRSGWLGVSWRPSRIWIASLRGSYRRDRYLDAVTDDGEQIKRKDDRTDVRCRIDYFAWSGFLRFYVEVFPWSVDSNFQDQSYDEMRIMAGCGIRY